MCRRRSTRCLLERRIGEHALPRGTWVVAAGNRIQDRALVRALSSALVNRVTILHLRVDVDEWLAWAAAAGVREDIQSFIRYMPDALCRPVPQEPVPFSTPRSWAALSRALDLCEMSGLLTPDIRRALAFGRLSPEDAAVYLRAGRGSDRRDARARGLHPRPGFAACRRCGALVHPALHPPAGARRAAARTLSPT